MAQGGEADLDADVESENGADIPPFDIPGCSEIEAVREWLKTCKKARILLAGKSRVGKSTLINAFFIEEKAAAAKDLKPTTKNVTPYCKRLDKHDAEIVFYDSPGLCDGAQTNDEHIKKMKETCEDRDLVMICIRMGCRLESEDKGAMRVLTAAFTKGMWNHAIFILTFANNVEPVYPRDGSNEEYFKMQFDIMKKELYQFMKDDLKIYDITPPVVAAGHPFKHKLPIPNCEDWRVEVLSKSIQRARTETAVVLLKQNLRGDLGTLLAQSLLGLSSNIHISVSPAEVSAAVAKLSAGAIKLKTVALASTAATATAAAATVATVVIVGAIFYYYYRKSKNKQD